MTNLSLKAFAVCCLLAVAMGHTQGGMAAEPGTITGVRLAPDQSSIVIQHVGQVGAHTSFVMQSPPRLVLDVSQAALARIPGKIPVGSARINEIRVGYTDSRVRIVVDFGKSSVPPFRIDRGEREIRLTLARGGALTGDRPAKPEKPRETKPAAEKAAAPPDLRKAGGALITVKSARADNNRVLLELAETGNPTKTYVLAVEMDAKNLNLRGATLRDDKGAIKRFQLSAAQDGIAGVQVETVEPWDKMGQQTEETSRPPRAKAKYTWGLKPTQDADRTSSGPTKKGAMHMEGFELKTRGQQGS
jgi:hypothetical protein